MPWEVAFCMFCACSPRQAPPRGRQGRRQGASAMWRGAGAWRRPSRAMAPVATVAATVAAKGARVAATVAAWSSQQGSLVPPSDKTLSSTRLCGCSQCPLCRVLSGPVAVLFCSTSFCAAPL